jgi:DsbC/DsbD-like thiol-disulfide interchange protein/cytochrome c biogenesis protein CcdA
MANLDACGSDRGYGPRPMVRQAVRVALFILVTLLAGSGALAQPARHVALTLVAESDRPAAGSEVALAFRAVPQPGWHGYWRNPGDAGVPTRVTWTLPVGARAGELEYPVPSRLLIAGLMNYVYEKPWALLTTLRVPAGLALGTRLPLVAKLDYLVCTAEICVPETQTLTLDLTVGDGAIDPARRAAFDGWRRALPRPLSTPATWQRTGDRFRLAVPLPADAPTSGVWFYPAGGGLVDYAAPQTVTRDGDTLTVETKAAASPATGEIAGVLAIGESDGLALTARPGTVAAPGGEGMLATALVAFAGAVLGGLLLNVMPCVFPILSLKALGLARSGESAAHARHEALAYTAGVLLVCVGLGAGLLALRAAGSSAGWAFQLQDPRVIGALLLLVTAVALNLAGLFELPTPQFAAKSGAAGAFATGALAAFVATPCTGPFMGAALGAALVLPAAAAGRVDDAAAAHPVAADVAHRARARLGVGASGRGGRDDAGACRDPARGGRPVVDRTAPARRSRRSVVARRPRAAARAWRCRAGAAGGERRQRGGGAARRGAVQRGAARRAAGRGEAGVRLLHGRLVPHLQGQREGRDRDRHHRRRVQGGQGGGAGR